MRRPHLPIWLITASFAASVLADEPAGVRREALVDLAGDAAPPGAIARLGTTRFRLRDYAPRSYFFGDGTKLLWMSQDKTVTIIDVETGIGSNSSSSKHPFGSTAEDMCFGNGHLCPVAGHSIDFQIESSVMINLAPRAKSRES